MACAAAAAWSLLAGTACATDPPEPVLLEVRTEGSRTVFLPDSLAAPAGARGTIRVVNQGEIAHNLVLVREEDAVQPIVLAAYQSIATEYVPTGFEDAILASTPLVYPGDTVDVAFDVPEAGRYTFVCVFPGHGSTMRGTLIATP
jgi:plastocyanin